MPTSPRYCIGRVPWQRVLNRPEDTLLIRRGEERSRMRRDEPSRTFSILKGGSENGYTSRPHSSDDCSNAASRRRAKARLGRDGRDVGRFTAYTGLSQEWSGRDSFNTDAHGRESRRGNSYLGEPERHGVRAGLLGGVPQVRREN